ncbi:1,4-dihydroxy-2-naphthoate polyprenyltransferase [Gordonia amarae]|uniref:1,4-dihydroxy-2-naphthoate octaprenyltransferase n=2 Tax=Gordonia amarae TaxID=36821 RepID=G7GR04_9ACTN|nr:1,4-dihydroxy-2-naphthoate polyprenyltransferase [Gordonia amarae]MCS3877552.1 1,4-dihydroxy-2-naphthoate octaprenyltransferase [Gordonia amarae]QHN16276.1 1,4-dihydroxy-2-naphthoate polyprenyltransferase [Gordonia amarae]QHN20845.1 1,4-dihydroxy-2-naphthoate polyprenyltransferase [Gordonia amarae]QHN29696.1 1,4-dihydroxy-2-naphthoate polyprenyltransferase [Gordonia amarae]QHN38472.1 1,4-dihydroxy-2-naphthoate polyprenyltransferase [Gordonia amarae]
MATAQQWIQGARPHTLPNAIAPVVAGVGAAAAAVGAGDVSWWRAALALLVALALIVGVNYANDYSDGIRGTDDERVGPMRLVGSGAAAPAAVKRAAFACFGVAAVCGLVLAVSTAWWLVVVGAVCIAGAWFYTGGAKPYGYLGFGEIAVFVFFGLVAVMGTQLVAADTVDWVGLVCAVAIGCFSSAVLVVNNLRDIPSDTESGKITLAVRLGDARTRILFCALLAVPLIASVVLAAATWWALIGLLAAPLIWVASAPVRGGAIGPALIVSLATTGRAMLLWAVATAVTLAVG